MTAGRVDACASGGTCIGFTLRRAKGVGPENFSVVCNHVTIIPPLRAPLESPVLRLDGFIGPGRWGA